MKEVLLDTHIFLWYAIEPHKLSRKVRILLDGEKTQRFVSVVSIWETAYLLETKPKSLKITKPLAAFWEEALIELRIEILNITPQHAQRFYEIQPIKDHCDQFDRMIIAQAASTGISVISDDGKFPAYKMIHLISND